MLDRLSHPVLRKIIKSLTLCFAVSLTAIMGMALVACDNSTDGSTSVQVGSKDFTENLILGELYALALEDQGIPVERRLGLSTAVVHEALINGDVDLFPEYTGTGLMFILGLPMETDPQVVFDTVQREYAEQFNVTWLDKAAVNNSFGIVITREISERYNITTISDFQREASNLRFASQGTFEVREDGLALLEEVYGPIELASLAAFDNALKYEVLRGGQADATVAYTTEGQLADPYFVLLEDDRRAWPPYNVAPIIRTEVLELHPEIAAILNAISADLTSEKMIELNAQVDVEGQRFEDVARNYFDSIRDSIQQ
ncbi:MAG: glycine/betaine ABC transporter substrate-binding protein [Coriobacteriia bacterium]|nr:glycine/betaine ABC transporter substrate-binding protein [Coriobacteriia bacterium]